MYYATIIPCEYLFFLYKNLDCLKILIMAKKPKKELKPRFDWEMLKLFTGIGILSGGIGLLLFWATYTAPEGAVTDAYALSVTQRLARLLPHDVKTKIAMVIAVLFMLFGLLLLLAAIYRTIRFILFKR